MAFDKKRVCPRYEVRLMTDDDIDEVLDIWREIGLYEGKHSIQTFKVIDPYAFYVAVNLEDGKIIGCCAGVAAHPTCVFVGLYAVRKKYQGFGIGLKTFQAVMKHVGNRNAGLYPIEHHLPTYRDKAGFTERDTHEVIVYEIEEPVNTNDLVHHISNVKIEPIRAEYMSAIAAFDERIVKHNREQLLRLTFSEPETISRVAIDLENGNVLAYGSLRTHNTDKVMGGPIYALNDGVAELLVYHLIKEFPPAMNGLTLMIPDINYGAQRMAKKMKIVELYRLCRLFTKSIPKAEMEKIYCIHSPNFYPF